MIKKDSSKVTGMLNIVVRDDAGKVKQEFTVPNLVVDSGLAHIAGRLSGDGVVPTAMSHMSVGTGSTAAAAGDTALGTEIARVALTSSEATANSVAYVATFPAGTGTGALTEAGVFNDVSAGTLLCRTVYAVINKGAADSMTVTWTVTIS